MIIKDFAEKYAAAWKNAIANGSTGHFKTFFEPGFVFHDHQIESDLADYLPHIERLTRNAQITGVEINYLTGSGDLFALDFKAHYSFHSDVPGMPPVKGKEVDSHYLCLLHTRNGKVDEGWSAGTVTGI
jgi:hypothetical protein